MSSLSAVALAMVTFLAVVPFGAGMLSAALERLAGVRSVFGPLALVELVALGIFGWLVVPSLAYPLDRSIVWAVIAGCTLTTVTGVIRGSVGIILMFALVLVGTLVLVALA